MAKKSHQVASPIRCDGKDYAVGDRIDLEDKDASGLLEVKAIELSSASSAPTAPADEAERIAAIVAAIGKLDTNDKTQWTTSGVPKVPAIEAITGWPLAGQERDTAWAQINAAK